MVQGKPAFRRASQGRPPGHLVQRQEPPRTLPACGRGPGSAAAAANPWTSHATSSVAPPSMRTCVIPLLQAPKMSWTYSRLSLEVFAVTGAITRERSSAALFLPDLLGSKV